MSALLWIAAGFLGGSAISFANYWLFTNHRNAWRAFAVLVGLVSLWQLAIHTSEFLTNLAIIYGTIFAIVLIARLAGLILTRREARSIARQRTAQWKMEHAEWAEW